MVYKPFHSELYQKSPKLLYYFNPSEALWILNTQHTPCLIASGAVHLIGNFPPSKLKSAPLASPKSDTCKNKQNNVLFMKLNAQIQSIIVKAIKIKD